MSLIFYDCIEYKSYDDTHHRLQELEEARGQLLRVFEAEGQAVATFAWGTVSFPGEMIDVLREMVGKMVCVLRLDGKYHLRAVDDAGRHHGLAAFQVDAEGLVSKEPIKAIPRKRPGHVSARQWGRAIGWP
mgnify:CR=1 FL=1